MKTEIQVKINEAVKLLMSAQSDLQELSEMDDAGDLHGQEVSGFEQDQADKLEDIISELDSL